MTALALCLLCKGESLLSLGTLLPTFHAIAARRWLPTLQAHRLLFPPRSIALHIGCPGQPLRWLSQFGMFLPSLPGCTLESIVPLAVSFAILAAFHGWVP